VNKTDPIMLDELHEPLFRYVTKGSSHRVYAYNLESLLGYLMTSYRFTDPMSGVAYDELEVWRLHKLRQRHFPDMRPDVDLMRLATDDEYRIDMLMLQAVEQSTFASVRALI
jgi:hypothetical protein